MKLMFLLLFILLFSACDLLETQAEKEKRVALEKVAFEKKVEETKEIQLKTLSAQTQKDLAILESQKELAKIEKETQIEKMRLESELEKQKLSLEQERVKALFEQNMRQKEQLDNMELKRYFVIFFGLFILLSLFFLFYYFKKRREDKLLAYNDNLQKYFYHKENEARAKIADKILDTLASGTLDKEQENQLISVFSGEAKGTYQKQITATKTKVHEIEDAEIVTDEK